MKTSNEGKMKENRKYGVLCLVLLMLFILSGFFPQRQSGALLEVEPQNHLHGHVCLGIPSGINLLRNDRS